MENKLTLEHLAPYLPYGLKVQYHGITNLQELADHNKKEPKGNFLDIIKEYEHWEKNKPAEIIGNRISVIKRIHFYKNNIRIYVGKRHGYLKLVCFNEIKPIFRPLSDIISARIVDSYGEMVTFSDYIDGDFDLGSLRWVLPEVANGQQLERLQDLPYCVWRELFKNNFDVFGLIEKGLAVDINTIDNA